MAHRERIEKLLSVRPGLCDDCIANELQISPRQIVRNECSKSGTILGSKGTCIRCGKFKIIRSMKTAPAPVAAPPQPVAGSNYLRQDVLRSKFNDSIAKTLGVDGTDYYGRLDFAGLLRLKAGYARIHDIITLKLTVALANWVGRVLDSTTLSGKVSATRSISSIQTLLALTWTAAMITILSVR